MHALLERLAAAPTEEVARSAAAALGAWSHPQTNPAPVDIALQGQLRIHDILGIHFETFSQDRDVLSQMTLT